MSKGNRIVNVRFESGILDSIATEIARRNLNTSSPPWSMSDFIRVAVAEKLKKGVRSRRKPMKPTTPVS